MENGQSQNFHWALSESKPDDAECVAARDRSFAEIFDFGASTDKAPDYLPMLNSSEPGMWVPYPSPVNLAFPLLSPTATSILPTPHTASWLGADVLSCLYAGVLGHF